MCWSRDHTPTPSKRHRHRDGPTLACLLILGALSTASAAPGPSALGPFHPRALQTFVSTRCNGVPAGQKDDGGGGGSAVWSYEGSLVDPTNGRIVAEVEGVELCRHLSEVHNSNNNSNNKPQDGRMIQIRSRARGLKRMGNLKARDMLLAARNDPQQDWDYATTVLSGVCLCIVPRQRNRCWTMPKKIIPDIRAAFAYHHHSFGRFVSDQTRLRKSWILQTP